MFDEIPISTIKIPDFEFLNLLVFNGISVIYVTAQMCMRIEEVVPTVGFPMP